jgi:AcrR family transcriptional regulator
MARPRRFDEEALLDAAQELFWVGGYDRTSIEDIAVASGVGNSSIYAAYTNKLGLFLAVFNRYCDGRVRLVEQVVAAHVGSFEEAVGDYLVQIVRDCTSHEDRRGCLMLNSISELGGHHPEVAAIAERTIARMDAVLTRRVEQSVESGEIALEPDRVEALGAHIVVLSQGLIQLSRIGASEARLRSIARASQQLSSLLAA